MKKLFKSKLVGKFLSLLIAIELQDIVEILKSTMI
jgi:hypothetical protein